jgi:hypothetical protein
MANSAALNAKHEKIMRGLLKQEVGLRGLHSSTFRLNLSASCGIGGASSGCLGVV